MPKIVIKRRQRDSDADAESNKESDPDVVDVDAEESNPPSEHNLVEDAPTPSAAPTKRPRGRPRGRGRGASNAVEAIGSRPRGRPRGRGRGRGRGAASRASRRAEDGDSDGDGSGDEDDIEDKAVPIGTSKPFRKVQDQTYAIEGDELITPDDPKGDEKIDQWGNLLGGRTYKANTFVIPNRHPKRLYMLAIDAARTSGFRDSLYYFRRNPLALKLNATNAEKDYLIGEGKLGSHLRTRSVTLITARSAFKLHGSKMIIDGRWVTDDYYEDKVRAECAERGIEPGELVGELPDPNASQTVDTGKNERANVQGGGASGGSLGIYRAGGPTTIFGGSGWGPYSDGPLNAVRKSLLSRDGVTEDNWMSMMAQRVVESNSEWTALRKEALKPRGGLLSAQDASTIEEDAKKRGKLADSGPPMGMWEPHSGNVYYRSDTQPTRSRLENVPEDSRMVLGGSKAGGHAWGLAWVDTIMEPPTETMDERKQPETIGLT